MSSNSQPHHFANSLTSRVWEFGVFIFIMGLTYRFYFLWTVTCASQEQQLQISPLSGTCALRNLLDVLKIQTFFLAFFSYDAGLIIIIIIAFLNGSMFYFDM